MRGAVSKTAESPFSLWAPRWDGTTLHKVECSKEHRIKVWGLCPRSSSCFITRGRDDTAESGLLGCAITLVLALADPTNLYLGIIGAFFGIVRFRLEVISGTKVLSERGELGSSHDGYDLRMGFTCLVVTGSTGLISDGPRKGHASLFGSFALFF